MTCKPESQHLKLTPLPILREIIAVVFTLSILVFATGSVLAQDSPLTPGPPEWVSDELLVGLRAGVSRGLAYRLISNREIRAVRLLGHEVLRIPRTEAERWMRECWKPVDGPVRASRR